MLSIEETTATSNLSLAVEHGVTLYSTVICFNRGGLLSSLSSDGVTVLRDPPTSDSAYVSISSPTYTPYAPRLGYLPTAAVILRWDGFVEPAGTSLEYQLRVLEGGANEWTNWTSVSFAKMVTVHEFQLLENTTHTVQIRAVNLGGVASPAVQSSFAIVSFPPEDTGKRLPTSSDY